MEHTWNWMMVLKDLLAIMNKGGRSQDEEDRVRRIMREVMSETSTASASERDMMHRMMQLLEHSVTKHSAELQATAQERDHYKAKMEELNLRMEQMLRDGGTHPSGGKGPVLTERQKRLAEIWEELQDIRQSKRSDQTTQGKPFNKGGGRGESGASGVSDRHWYQSQNECASFQFVRQNKDGTPYCSGEYPFQGRDSEKLETSLHKDFKSGGFQSKPFQRDNRYQGPVSSSKMFTQRGGRGGKRDFGPSSSNTHDNHGLQSDNRHWQGDSGSGFSDRDAVQNVGMQNHGPNRGSYQHRGRHNDRGQHQQRRGQCNLHRGQFHQHRAQSQDGRQNQRSIDSGSRKPSDDFSSSQFTPEEIEAIKSVLKAREAGAECTGKSGSVPLLVNPSKMAAKKKEQKKPKGAVAVLPDDSDSDEKDAFKSSKEGISVSGDAGNTRFDVTTDAKPVSDSKKKKKRVNKKGSKDQATTEQKPEGLSPLEVFTASGFDVSQVAGMNMDQAVNDLMLITKEDGNIVSCQPKTVRELVEFKQQYPNAQAIIVKTSEQK